MGDQVPRRHGAAGLGALGREPEWNEQRAERELGKRLQAVERDGWRKPERVSFAAFADRFEADYLPGRASRPRR